MTPLGALIERQHRNDKGLDLVSPTEVGANFIGVREETPSWSGSFLLGRCEGDSKSAQTRPRMRQPNSLDELAGHPPGQSQP
jgi:hypothetical protein